MLETRKTVRVMQKQMDEKRKEEERNEAVAMNEEIAKCIFIIKNIIQDVDFSNINENMRQLEILLFNRYGYIIEKEKRSGMFAYFNLLHDKSHGKGFTKEEKEKFDEIGQGLLQYFWKTYERASDICIKNSIISKEIMEERKKILKNDQTQNSHYLHRPYHLHEVQQKERGCS